MKKLKIVVVGYGNVGKFTVEAVKASPDMELAGVVRRVESLKKKPAELSDIKVVSDIEDLGKVDVAILCGPSRSVPELAPKYLEKGIYTVDCFDIHTDIFDLHEKLGEIARNNKVAAVTAAGCKNAYDGYGTKRTDLY